MQSPIHQDEQDGLWYFWDETWAYRYGPYISRVAAYLVMRDYCKKILLMEIPEHETESNG